MDGPFSAYDGDDSFIFVSYAHANSETVFPDITQIRGIGYNIWYDEGISAGSVWREEIATAIKKCDLFIFFVTPESVVSENCLGEIGFALEEQRVVLAIHLTPTQLPDGLRLALNRRQAVLKYELDAKSYPAKLAQYLGEVLKVSPGPRTSFETIRSTKLVAVMPFRNLAGDAGQDFFAEGLAEDVLNSLAMIPEIQVKARTSSFRLGKENVDIATIRDQLNVTHVVEGSVRRAGNQVRVVVRLLDVVKEEQVWSEVYDRLLDDIFAVQDEITRSVLKSLGLHLSANTPHARTVSPEAYDAYLLGKYRFNHLDFDGSIEALDHAVTIDPNFAEAHGQLAWVHSFDIWWARADMAEKLPHIASHADAALKVDPENHMAKVARITNCFFVDRKYQESIDALHELITRSPSEASQYLVYAAFMHTIGRSEVAVDALKRAVSIDPLSPHSHRLLAEGLMFANKFDAAKKTAAYAQKLGAAEAHLLMFVALEEQDLLEFFVQIDRPDEAWGLMLPYKHLFQAYVDDLNNDPEAARKSRQRAISQGNPDLLFFRFGQAQSTNDLTAAFEILEQMIRSGDYLAIRDAAAKKQAMINADFHKDSRFDEMLIRNGIDRVSFARIEVPPFQTGY